MPKPIARKPKRVRERSADLVIDLSMYPADHSPGGEDDFLPIEQAIVAHKERYAGTDEIQLVEGWDEPRKLRSSWDVFDVASALLHGIPPEVEPTVLRRMDGPALLYQGKVSSIAGPPESAKGWFALAACRQEILNNEHVVYVDFEDSPDTVIRRLLQLGIPEEHIGAFFHLVNPIERFDAKDPNTGGVFFHMLADTEPTLVILDGLTQALSNNELDDNKNTDVVQWFRELPRKIITATAGNAAVLIVDHVTKADDAAKRYALGAGQKLAALDGSQFKAKMIKPFSPGKSGRMEIFVTKDRPGNVRSHAWGDSVESGQHIASMELESVEGPDHFVKLRLWPGGVAHLRETADKQIVSPRMMDDIMAVMVAPGQTMLNRSQLYRLLRGSNQAKVIALNELLKDSKIIERKENHDTGPLKLFVNPHWKDK